MRPVIITCALTGDSDTPSRSAHVPVTPEQIATDALAASEAGAAIVHIHVRDPGTGKGSRDVALYREVAERIAVSGANVIVNFTAGMGGKLVFGGEKPMPPAADTDLVGATARMAHILALRPEMCSLDCGSFNSGMGDEIYVSTTPMILQMAEKMRDLGVKPELEVFDFGHMRLACHLVEKGLVEPPPLFQFALGLRWGAPSDAATMIALRAMLPAGAQWVAFGAGAEQLPVAAQSVLLGGNVRVGLEDNLYRRRGVLASNADLVEDAVRLVETLGHRAATPAEARALLGIPIPVQSEMKGRAHAG